MTDTRVPRAGDHVAVVHEQLRAAILAGVLRPGEVTSQVALARDLDAGRTPLREALRMLQNEGLVLAQPNRRVQIAPLSLDDAEALYVLRVANEAVAARLTTPLLSRGDIAELEGLMAQMAHLASSGPEPLMATPHRAFHARFIAGAGPRAVALIEQLFDHAERYRREYGAAGAYARRQGEHRAILDAAAAADGDAVADALALHYVHTARMVADALQPGHPLDRLRATVAAVAPGALVAFEPAPTARRRRAR